MFQHSISHLKEKKDEVCSLIWKGEHVRFTKEEPSIATVLYRFMIISEDQCKAFERGVCSKDPKAEQAVDTLLDILVDSKKPEALQQAAYIYFVYALVLTGHFEAANLLEDKMKKEDKDDILRRYYPKPLQRVDCNAGDPGATDKISATDTRTQTCHEQCHEQSAQLPAPCLPMPEPLGEKGSVRTTNYPYGDLCWDESTMYRMDKNPRGLALIINNETFLDLDPRTGTDLDEQSLTKVFKELYIDPVVHRNLGRADMMRIIEDFAKRREHGDAQAYFVVIMTHGYKYFDSADFLYTYEGCRVVHTDVERLFATPSAPALKGKPKVFIYVSCRGHEMDSTNRVSMARVHEMLDAVVMQRFDAIGGDPMARPGTVEDHPETDMLMLYSTRPGKASMRITNQGTWFIQELCKVIEEEAHQLHFKDIVEQAELRVRDKEGEKGSLQHPEHLNRGFVKKLYLNPGYYKEQEELLPSQLDDHIELALPIDP